MALEIPDLGGIDFEEYNQSQKIHDIGYRAAKEFLTKNPELLAY